ncbi:MAG: hypothetical protein E7596_03445 [Ruminococcaceae bacterium]|nr:hypothetical protein [Oscillospiraceae bacterium]
MKNFKRIASLVLALMLALSMVALMASCGEDENPPASSQSSTGNSTTGSSNTDNSTGTSKPGNDDEIDMSNPNLVKITVVDEKGNAIKGAEVQICQGENCFMMPIITGENGVGVREYSPLSEEVLKAKVKSIEGYKNYMLPADDGYVYFQSGSRELTITVRSITVNVFDQNGKSIENATVQLYQGEYAFKGTLVTNEDGIASTFIAVSGDELSAVVTKIDSDKAYDIESDPTAFGVGVYDGTVVVKKLEDYVVKLSTMLGTNIEGAKVELFNAENGRKQKTVYTNANGIAKFEGMTPAGYYVVVTIEDPTYKIYTEDVDGKYYFADGSFTLMLGVVHVDRVTYTVKADKSLAGSWLSIYDSNHNYVDIYDLSNEEIVSVTFDENGVATFMAPYGEYIVVCYSPDDNKYAVPVVFTKNGVLEGEVTLKDLAQVGSTKDNPYYAVSGYASFIEAPACKWYAVPFADGKLVSVNNYSGVNYTIDLGTKTVIEDETYSFNGVANGANDMMVFSIEPKDNNFECYIEVSAPGSSGAPYDINEILGDDVNGKSEVIDLIGGNYVYYEYTASQNGTLTITLPYSSVILGVLNADGLESVVAENSVSISVPVTKGYTVVFFVAGVNLETYEAVDIEDAQINFTFGEVKKSYTVTTYVDFAVKEGVTVILYKQNEDLELVEVSRTTSDANGVATFAEVEFSHGYVAKAIPPQDYVATEEYKFFGYVTDTQIYMSHERDGSKEYPYEVDHETGTGSLSVSAGGTTWLYVYVHASFDGTKFVLTINDANAKFEVYYADSEEGNGTPCGVSELINNNAVYTFKDNGKGYMIAISTANGEAADLEYTYATVAAEEGETTDNAKEFDRTDSAIETITAGKTVYYRYTGDSGKLTVKLIGEGVSLKAVEFAVGTGEHTLKDTVDNTLVVDNTQGSWIYFAVVADMDTTYELGITVE